MLGIIICGHGGFASGMEQAMLQILGEQEAVVAIDFPDLKIIGIHIGVPWTDEMISMAWKHENVYIGVDAYAPKHWPPQLVHYLNTYGREKVLFGTDWPVIETIRAVKEIRAMDLRPESYRALMRHNAIKVFNLQGMAEA